MKKASKAILTTALVLAVCLTVLQNVVLAFHSFTNIAAIQYVDGGVLVAQYQDGGLAVEHVGSGGTVIGSFSVPQKSGGYLVTLSDMAADSTGNVYLLLDLSDPLTGERMSQELAVYRPDRLLFKKVSSHVLSAGEEGVRWRWLTVTSSVSVLGTTPDGMQLVRDVYEPEGLVQDAITPKSSRTYPLDQNEGIWRAWAMGSSAAYISGSGKLFVANEEQAPEEIYPARVLDRVMYPIFASPIDTESMYLGEQESGDLLSINLSTRETTVLKSGTEPFSGTGSYAPVDLVQASMGNEQNFAGVVKNESENRYELILSVDGQVEVISSARPGLAKLLGSTVLWLVLWTTAFVVILTLVCSVLRALGGRRTLMAKLMSAAIPLLTLSVVLFGAVSYRTYATSIRQSFEKQVVDEGNMLMALFGTESFEGIEYPYDYTGDDYGYLLNQMNTRSVYTRIAYYERGQLYTGVDRDAPCFYPFSVNMNVEADELYLKAAYTGTAQTGVLRDKNGERLVCVTPVGGVSGSTVYLLETGILMDNVRVYTRGYLWSFCLVGAVFLAVVSGVLALAFRRVLRPLNQIQQGLELFAQGDRTVRLDDADSEEFSGIVRVFNKMAGDIDVQIYNLRQTSATYFRFIPQKVFQLLGKENLGDLDLASGQYASYHILSVDLRLLSRLTQDQVKERTDRFFAIVDNLCEEHGAILLTDSVNLRRLQVICPAGGDSAVDIALSALSRLDEANAATSVQSRMEAFFLVHKTDVYYGICGDERRLVPTMISTEMDELAAQTDELRRFSSRLVVTRAALDGVDEENYFHRFIGCPEGADETRFGLYDFYDSCTPEQIRLINETRATFDKAMELYRAGRWYDAKNMFAVVLRENQYDNVSRTYIFRCEKRL
ncbi:hypothetical protein [uncultured Ruthenibacterium sp.]|uniref:HAMP domain-containing protein n=1 Tax=uncultured Ruthenibacterium sp. TaxID=1905347 RepID=UPI00349EBB59